MLSTDGELRPDTAATIGSQIASALAAAHRAGIVHRDIKPGNVLLASDGTAKITDFGISHAVGDVTVTATGILAGTPAYLAPEVAQGKSAGFPSDVFSLGSTLYTALEGTPPFGLHDNAIAQLHQVAAGEIIPPSRSGALTPVLLRLLQRDPAVRPAMEEVGDALTALAGTLVSPPGGQPVRRLPRARNNPPVARAPRRQQTLIGSARLDETMTQAPPAGVNARAGRLSIARKRNGWRQRRRFLVGAVAVVLLAGGLLVAGLINYGRVGGDAAANPPGTSDSPARSLPAQPGPSSPAPISPGQGATEPKNTPTVPGGLPDTPEQSERAITDYYALIPDDLPTAWQRLTQKYQQNHAGGFTGYQDFWNPIQRVTVSDVTASQEGAVTATIDYFFKDGRVVEEQTSYGLVPEEGQWKIDSSTVRSSQTKQGS